MVGTNPSTASGARTEWGDTRSFRRRTGTNALNPTVFLPFTLSSGNLGKFHFRLNQYRSRLGEVAGAAAQYCRVAALCH